MYTDETYMPRLYSFLKVQVMSNEAWWIVGAFFALGGLHFLAMIAAGLWEKRPIQPYSVPEPGQEYASSEAANLANLAAVKLGYRHGGLCHDNKGRLYRVRYDFWIANDNATIAVIGSGSVASSKVDGIWLWSRLMSRQILCTTNERGEQEICGIIEQQTWPQRNLKQLDEIHKRRLATDVVEPFSADSPMLGYFEIRRLKAEALVNQGYADYVDDEHTIWRYTFNGALAFYFTAVWVRPISRALRAIGIGR
jgi:hypothetical protein